MGAELKQTMFPPFSSISSKGGLGGISRCTEQIESQSRQGRLCQSSFETPSVTDGNPVKKIPPVPPSFESYEKGGDLLTSVSMIDSTIR